MNRKTAALVSTLGTLVLLSPALGLASESTQPDLHKKVSAALTWQMPDNSCEKPSLTGDSTDIVDKNGIKRSYDMDSYKLGRYNRKMKRWNKCTDRYKQGLSKDYDTLMGSAQHGLTQDQANRILTKMAAIQTRIITLSQN